MYLSRAEYSLRPGQDLDPYREHQMIAALCAPESGVRHRFLYRSSSVGASRRYYLLTQTPPRTADGRWRIETKPFAPQLVVGQRLYFSLRLNPVVTRKDAEGKRRRHDLVQDLKRAYREAGESRSQAELAQEAGNRWLADRAEAAGIAIDPGRLLVEDYRALEFRKPGASGCITIATLDLSGQLRVVDPVALQARLLQGLGPAKGFGCGLLLIRPA